MRVLFLGTPGFAVPSLRALLESSRYQVSGVITQPDRPAGRGRKLKEPAVKTVAEAAGIPVLQPETLKNRGVLEDFLEMSGAELAVVAAYGRLLPDWLFDSPPLGTLNVHASLLPRYRGASPIIHALINGDADTGITIMKIDSGMDTGDIVAQASVEIGPDITAGELEAVLADKGAEVLLETIPGYAEGTLKPRPQDPGQATYARPLGKEEARIDWNWPAQRVHNWVRALNPNPSAFTHFRGTRVKVWRTARVEGGGLGGPGRKTPGEIIGLGPDRLLVECGDGGILNLTEVQLPSRNRYSSREFINGLAPGKGERFI